MSISRKNYLIIGFDFSDSLDADAIDELCEKLNCDYVYYNDGYDEPGKIALVPKKSTNIVEYSFDKLELMVNNAKRINEVALSKGINLPPLVIKSVTCTN